MDRKIHKLKKTPEDVIKVSLRNFKTNEIFVLEKKKGSYCHFLSNNEKLSIPNYEIKFRLDWNDLNAYGDPTLDTDFYDLETGEKVKSTKSLPGHHTLKSKNLSLKRYQYIFVHEDIEIIFETEITRNKTLKGKSRITK